jgi:hypothetical protein
MDAPQRVCKLNVVDAVRIGETSAIPDRSIFRQQISVLARRPAGLPPGRRKYLSIHSYTLVR